ncbi:MAG: hypothetical protein BWY91_03036 [bacterium ADurb.BinA028]|nr:MAG: hypothetical protein BWY91_03036 [bacterium ADurb.BinA028]
MLVLEGLGHGAADDVLGQPLDDGGLADAGLPDEDGVVLRASGQDLHDPLDLFLTPDHRVELAFAGRLGEVATELVEHERPRRSSLGLARGRADARGGLLALPGLVAGEQLDDLLADLVEVGAELDQHLGSHALALTDEAEQDVLGADVGVTQLQPLAQGILQDLLGARGERNVPRRRLLALADDLGDLLPHGVERDPEVLQRLGGQPLTLVDETEEDVLGADVVVVEHARLFLREHNHSPGAVREPFEHR